MEPSAGLTNEALVERWFVAKDQDPYSQINWVVRDAWPEDSKYHVKDVEAPDFWSDNAVNITSKLYLSKAKGAEEMSVRDLVHRVAHKITVEGIKGGYFGESRYFNLGRDEIEHPRDAWADDAEAFYRELSHIMLNQLAVFNSPVLFNVGRADRKQQVSACFILGVDDTTESIMETAQREAFIFKGGSGSGSDVSNLRGSTEPLSTGGTASGPVSFMRLWDAGAGTFKSGGTTRRAAVLRKCDADHPDIRDFITCKAREEARIEMLMRAGVDLGFSEEGERNLAECTSFQNANNSVGATDRFMKKATGEDPDPDWELVARKNDRVMAIDYAPKLIDLIASSAHRAACPGMLFTDTWNAMHTTPSLDGKESLIRSTNPCGEYGHNDDTSCNLGSVNVLKFVYKDGEFDVESFRHTVDVMSLAMEICVNFGHFPDEKLELYSRGLRPLGLGYSNMGAAIMAQGLAYDSDEGRDFAASVTALLTGRAYRKSAQVARSLGPFHYFDENRETMLAVLRKQADALPGSTEPVWMAADMDWLEALALGAVHGFRNSQATVIPPAGTTSYFLDCDTTGIEPAYELRIHKDLAGGGTMTIVNQSVDRALRSLGYPEDAVKRIEAFLRDHGRMPFGGSNVTADDAMVATGHEAVFHGANEISPEGHIKMMAAVQPFVSGGISKTINMHEDASVEEVKEAYVLAWRLGCKGLAIYRNGSKSRQVHTAKLTSEFPYYKDGQIVEVDPSIVFGQPEVESNVEQALRLGAEVRAGGGPVIVTPSDIADDHGTLQGVDSMPPDAWSTAAKKAAGGFAGTEFSAIGGGPQRRQEQESPAQISPPPRRRLPRTRESLTHKIHLRGQMGEYEGYVQAGRYPDGTLGEVFIEGFGKQGSFTQTALAAMATSVSIGIQYGMPWVALVRKFLNVSDETGGVVVPDPEATGPPAIRSAKSIVDYIARWLVLEFGDVDLHEEFGVRSPEARARREDQVNEVLISTLRRASTNGHSTAAERGPGCPECGQSMRPTGGCWTCACGYNTGCG